MGAARIGRIRLKAGGAEVRLIRQETPNGGGENWAGVMLAQARKAGEYVAASGPMTGFVMVALYADGGTWTSYRWGKESPFNRALLPSYVAEIIRRDVITEEEVRVAVNRANGYTNDD